MLRMENLIRVLEREVERICEQNESVEQIKVDVLPINNIIQGRRNAI